MSEREETPALLHIWLSIFRGPEVGRRFFLVLETTAPCTGALPEAGSWSSGRLSAWLAGDAVDGPKWESGGSKGDPGGARTESGEDLGR